MVTKTVPVTVCTSSSGCEGLKRLVTNCLGISCTPWDIAHSSTYTYGMFGGSQALAVTHEIRAALVICHTPGQHIYPEQVEGICNKRDAL